MTSPQLGARTVKFDTPRPLTDYLDDNGRPTVPGHEVEGLLLSPLAIDALAVSKMSGNPCEIVVTGEEWMPDGRHFLRFGVARDYIEATTDYRHEPDHGLRYVCPECLERSGKHRKVRTRG